MARARAQDPKTSAVVTVEDRPWMEGYVESQLKEGTVVELIHESGRGVADGTIYCRLTSSQPPDSRGVFCEAEVLGSPNKKLRAMVEEMTEVPLVHFCAINKSVGFCRSGCDGRPVIHVRKWRAAEEDAIAAKWLLYGDQAPATTTALQEKLLLLRKRLGIPNEEEEESGRSRRRETSG